MTQGYNVPGKPFHTTIPRVPLNEPEQPEPSELDKLRETIYLGWLIREEANGSWDDQAAWAGADKQAKFILSKRGT